MTPEFGYYAWQTLVQRLPDLADQDQVMIEVAMEDIYREFRWRYPSYAKPKDEPEQIPPSFEEVRIYFLAINSTVNPQDFWDHYEMVGWVVGVSKTKMKKWRPACALWDRRDKAQIKPGQERKSDVSVSLYSLQTRLKSIEEDLEALLRPGGSPYVVTPTGEKMERYKDLMAQRDSVKKRMLDI